MEDFPHAGIIGQQPADRIPRATLSQLPANGLGVMQKAALTAGTRGS
jgi:hypothetical protein